MHNPAQELYDLEGVVQNNEKVELDTQFYVKVVSQVLVRSLQKQRRMGLNANFHAPFTKGLHEKVCLRSLLVSTLAPRDRRTLGQVDQNPASVSAGAALAYTQINLLCPIQLFN